MNISTASVLLVGLIGCYGGARESTDAGFRADTFVVDATMSIDAGRDAAIVDAGPADGAGLEDIGIDAFLDATALDSEVNDASLVDVSLSDSGSLDAVIASDSGPRDAGSDAVVILPNVVVEDQRLTLSTQIIVAQLAYGDGAYQVTIRDHARSAIGSRTFDAGTYVAQAFVLSRPSVDGELLHAELWAVGGTERLADASFTVTHADAAVAIRFNVSNDGASNYSFDSVEPEAFAGVLSARLDPAVTLYRGWRYEVRSSSFSSAHPSPCAQVPRWSR